MISMLLCYFFSFSVTVVVVDNGDINAVDYADVVSAAYSYCGCY